MEIAVLLRITSIQIAYTRLPIKTERTIWINAFSMELQVIRNTTYMTRLPKRACKIPIKFSKERRYGNDGIKRTKGRINSTIVVARAAPKTSIRTIKTAFNTILLTAEII